MNATKPGAPLVFVSRVLTQEPNGFWEMVADTEIMIAFRQLPSSGWCREGNRTPKSARAGRFEAILGSFGNLLNIVDFNCLI